MYAEAMQKKVMNGSVVPMLDKPRHDEIEAKLEKFFNVFYVGDKLSPLELDIERQYLSQKYAKTNAFRDRPTTKNKTKWTISDLNRY